MSTPILTTKLYIPPTRPELVSRPRLIERLNEGLGQNQGFGRKLTLISAPAGFGKTTLVSSWIYDLESDVAGTGKIVNPKPVLSDSRNNLSTVEVSKIQNRVAWLSLDDADNDPTRFLVYFIAALQQIDPDIGQAAQGMLLSPPVANATAVANATTPPAETLMTTLINDIATISIDTRCVLVLDDYHAIATSAIHDALTFLLDHLPPQMHLVITSRVDPPLPLARLRGRGQLTELRADDLRFTAQEAVTFLNEVMGLNLSTGNVQALETHTEGWITGLQLAALALQAPLSQGRSDIESFIANFTGSHRYILDYLIEEVLSRQPENMQKFLLQTSILDRLCGPLCDAVVGRLESDDQATDNLQKRSVRSVPVSNLQSQEVLEYLEQTNLFIIPLDDERRWYRYHHLFAHSLQEHLRRTVDEEELVMLHRRASTWYAHNELPVEAVNHALAAGDFEQATQLIEQLALAMLTHGEVGTVLSWLQALPEELIHSRPRFSLARAWAMIITDEWEQVEPLLQEAERSLAEGGTGRVENRQNQNEAEVQGMWGEVAAIRAMIANNQGDAAQAIELSRQALERLPEDNLTVRSVITMNLGNAYQSAGNLAQAGQVLAEAVAMAQAAGNLITVLSAASSSLALLQEEQGHLHQAAQTYRQALQSVEQWTEERGQSRPTFPTTGWAYLGLAEVLREQNDLEAAKRYLTIGLQLGQQGNMLGLMEVGHIIQARILQAQGDAVGAIEAIRQAERLVQKPSPLFPWVAAVQARVWLVQGNLAAAASWAKTCGLRLDDGFNYPQLPGEYATLVRVLIAQGRFEEALALLKRMHSVAESTGRVGRMLEILILQALTLYAQNNPEQALSPLTRALTIAEPEGYVRIFVDEGLPMVALLRQAASRDIAPDYVSKLLDAFLIGEHPPVYRSRGTEEKENPPALIDPLSERELEVLQLVTAGMSNQEIAQKLVIAVSTVKSHTNKIFSKLDVQNRTQAVARARELNLL